jgi:prolyl-tRNA editing enzyme YbaK/EbsC (Cys-tRNA(Pro) deacylase)
VSSAWPADVERVARVLRDAGVEARLEEFGEGTPTAEDAARAAGCSLPQIVKSLVFACDGAYALVLVPGDRRADRTKVAREAGCVRAVPASPDDVHRVTGFAVGGVAPFPLPDVKAVLMERTLLGHDVVWIGAGSPSHMAEIAPSDLAKLTKARVIDAVSENT